MPIENDPGLAEFDAGAAMAAAREAAGEDLLAVAEFTPDGFRLLYVADELVEAHGGPDEVRALSGTLHDYIHVDFTERRLFEDLYPTVEDVYAFVTHTDAGCIARVLAADEGMYLSFSPDADVDPVVEAVVDVVRGA